MKLEDQVTSLELSKRLKELGVKQESLFSWADIEHYTSSRGWMKSMIIIPTHESEALGANETSYAAFTVAELGEMLPNEIDETRLSIHKEEPHGWSISYDFITDNSTSRYFINSSLADTTARMLIWLIEEGKVKV